MSSLAQPIVIYKGEDKSFILTFTDENGDRIDLTPFTAIEFEVKVKAGDADPALISKTLGAGITKLTQSGLTLGQAQLDVDGPDTSGLTARLHKYDVVAIDGSAQRHTVIPPNDFDLREVVNSL
jgi:hypothetical protein